MELVETGKSAHGQNGQTHNMVLHPVGVGRTGIFYDRWYTAVNCAFALVLLLVQQFLVKAVIWAGSGDFTWFI